MVSQGLLNALASLRQRIAQSLSFLLLYALTTHVTGATPATKLPTLADAFGVKSTGAIAVSPDGKLLAIEAERGILVLDAQSPFTRRRQLDGSFPSWSPDSEKLAFYSQVNGGRQIALWHRDSDLVEQISNVARGITPNPTYYMGNTRSFAWAPDSTAIAFCTRLLDDQDDAGQPPRVRVLSRDSTWHNLMDGVFRLNFWETFNGGEDWSVSRMKAVAIHPEMAFNKLFVIDVRSHTLQQLTKGKDQHFFPEWAPDGRRLAAVVALDNVATSNLAAPAHTALSIFDVRSGSETRIIAPLPRLGSPHWSSTGAAIALLAQHRVDGFSRVEIYLVNQHRWSSLAMPKGMSALDVKWSKDRHSLLARAADRFVDTLWRLDVSGGRATQIDTGNLAISRQFDESQNGDVFFSAEAVSFVGRVFVRPAAGREDMRQVYEPNPQLADLQFQPQRRVTWKNAAGDEVDGLLILPPNYEPRHGYPVIVDVYPRPARDAFMLRLTPGMGQAVAAQGYVVLVAALRAPHAPYAFSRDERYTEKARGAKGIPILVDDFTSAVQFLSEEGIADTRRLCIFGHSNGGYVVNFLITETDLARCAVVWSGSSDAMFQQYFEGPPSLWINEITNGNIYDNYDEFVKMSPLFRMNQVNTPLLMLVGDGDWDTWLPEMLMEFSALQQLGKDATLARYDGEGHTFSKREDIEDSFARIMTFFDTHLAHTTIIH